MRRTLLPLALLALPALASAQATSPPAPPLLDRVVVMGASVSGCFGIEEELEAEVRLGDFLDLMLVGERPESVDLGDVFFFTSPYSKGPEVVKATIAAEPTLVFAIDFPFWFGYRSEHNPKEDRVERLDFGLALLDKIDAPLVVGDFPDMTIALGGVGPFGGPLITPHMIPSAEELERLNARLYAWAEAKGDVTVVPMASFVQRMLQDEEIVSRGNTWPAGSLKQLLQPDLLHPTRDGLISLLILSLDHLVAARDDLDEEHVRWDAKEISEAIMAATHDARESAREKRAERERKKAEREARRAARDKEDADGGGGSPLLAA